MRIRPYHIIACTLVLLVANMGAAHAALRLCRNKCENAWQNRVEVPACCQSKDHHNQSRLQSEADGSAAADCPHVNNGKRVNDSFAFLTGSSRLPAPVKYPAFTGLVPHPAETIQVASRPGMHTHSGLSPPGTNESPPRYILNCSFLI